VTTDWAETHAPKPGDLIYCRDPESGEVYTDRAFVVVENEGVVPAEHLAETMPFKTYWNVRVSCDRRCGELGYSDCYWPEPDYWMLSADDFVLVSRLPEFQVVRS
jgi:hypothetical protein